MPGLRVVLDGPRDPRLNMAIDEALARSTASGGPPTLRIYMWLPAAVSVGRSQDFLKAVRLGEAARRGYVVVRRPTGGGALLHSSKWEITYSVALPPGHPLAELDVASSAAEIARGVALALRRLGFNADVRGRAVPGRGSAELCLEIPGSSDVIVSGRKVSGSAQARIGGAVLQHGSILLRVVDEEWSVIRGSQPASRFAAGLYDFGLNARVSDVVEALVDGFSEVLDARPGSSSLTASELALALELLESRYYMPGWSYPPLAGGARGSWPSY